MSHLIEKRSVIRWATQCAAAAVLAIGASAQAQDSAQAHSVYAQWGGANTHSQSWTVGITGPIDWQTTLWGGRLTAYWDVYASAWNASQTVDGQQHFSALGLTGTLRLRPQDGQSPWFYEVGTGPAWISPRYSGHNEVFSTNFNFGTHLGVGFNFGEQRQQELALRLEHFSNAGIHKPNPGENFLEVRYGWRF